MNTNTPPRRETTAIPRDPATTSRIMRSVRSKNTGPELALRRAVHARGGRFRLHASDVPGRPDMVVRSRKIAIFIDGDLWHGNPDEWKRRGRPDLASLFPTRTTWWVQKIERNMERDRAVNSELRQQGWRVVRLWASDVLANTDASADHILSILRSQT